MTKSFIAVKIGIEVGAVDRGEAVECTAELTRSSVPVSRSTALLHSSADIWATYTFEHKHDIHDGYGFTFGHL